MSTDAKPPLAGATGSVRFLAREIARELFTSGDGVRAERLRFILNDHREYGGWSEPAAAAQIERVILRRLASLSPNAPTQQSHISSADGVCKNCTHWRRSRAASSTGYCELFGKTTDASHGNECTAYEP